MVQRFNSSSLNYPPIFVLWRIWLGSNRALFQNLVVFYGLIAHIIRVSFLEQVKHVKEKKRRDMRELEISNGVMWGFLMDPFTGEVVEKELFCSCLRM